MFTRHTRRVAQVECDAELPADVVLLQCSGIEACCFVQTTNMCVLTPKAKP